MFERLELDVPSPLQQPLLLLQLGALFVLLVGCMNVINLVASRAAQRADEYAIRYALGAGLIALGRLLFIENLLLTAIAAGVGISLGSFGLQWANQYLQNLDPGMAPVSMGLATLLPLILGCLGIAVLMKVIPLGMLWHAGMIGRPHKDRGGTQGTTMARIGGSLVVGEVAFTFALLFAAALLLRSFVNVVRVEPGFDAAHVVTMRIERLYAFYGQRADTAKLRQRLITAIEQIPGVESVGVATIEALQPHYPDYIREFVMRGQPPDAAQQVISNSVSADYFATMGIPVISGRGFTEDDTCNQGNPGTYVVDELFAERYLADSTANTQMVTDNRPPVPPRQWGTIIGVVGRANVLGLENRDGLPVIYDCMNDRNGVWDFSLVVRTTRPTADIAEAMRRELTGIDARLPAVRAMPLDAAIAHTLVTRRAVTTLLTAFACSSLVLSLLGIYAMLSYNIACRTREFGIRQALGADNRALVGLVLRKGVALSMSGLVLGGIGAALMAGYLRQLLFDVQPFDLAAVLSMGLFVLVTCVLACILPAYRAASLDPAQGLAEDY